MRQDHKYIKHFIPFGEAIRGFANQQFVSAAEISRILRSRGVFAFNQDKEYTIPILQTLLLCPREFDELRECYRYREDRYKTISREIRWEKDVTLSKVNNYQIDLEGYIRHHMPNCELMQPIRFSEFEGNANHIISEFTIQRHDVNKSWYEQTNIFSGTVEFINDGGKGRIVIKHTAPETKVLAEEIVKIKIGQFKDNRLMPKDNTPQKILFQEFKNENRFVFFYRLTTKMQNSDIFTCKDIKDISIKPDDSCDILPEGINWMKRMKKIIISGESLGQTFFMKDKEYHGSLILWSIDALFDYEYKGERGNFTATLGFSDYPRKGNSSEFEIVISALNNERNLDGKTRKKLLADLQAELDKQKSIVYNNFIEYQNRNSQ